MLVRFSLIGIDIMREAGAMVLIRSLISLLSIGVLTQQVFQLLSLLSWEWRFVSVASFNGGEVIGTLTSFAL